MVGRICWPELPTATLLLSCQGLLEGRFDPCSLGDAFVAARGHVDAASGCVIAGVLVIGVDVYSVDSDGRRAGESDLLAGFEVRHLDGLDIYIDVFGGEDFVQYFACGVMVGATFEPLEFDFHFLQVPVLGE